MSDDFDSFVKRWREFKLKYPFRKWIFNLGIFFLLGLLVLAWYQVGFDKDPRKTFFGRIECPVHGGDCVNPLEYCNNFTRNELCDQVPVEWLSLDFLVPGQVLELRPPWIIRYFHLLLFLVLGACFLLNHVLNLRQGVQDD
jgi:hypothetical protein